MRSHGDGDSDDAAMIHTNSNSLALSTAIDNVNTLYSLGLDLAIQNPGATYSDHASFWNNSFPAVLLIEDWTFDSNPYYHTANDRVMYFNVPYYEKMSKLAIASISTLAIPVTGTGSTEDKYELPVSLYPNPVSSRIYLHLNEIEPTVTISVFDCSGKVVLTNAFNSQQNIILDVSLLNSGLYFIQIGNGEQIKSIRFVKN